MPNARRIITRDEDSIDIDAGIKNKWNWSWLEKKDNSRCQESCSVDDLERRLFNFILCWRIYKKGINQNLYRHI